MLRPSAPNSPSPVRVNTGPPTGNLLALVKVAIKLATPVVKAMIDKRKEGSK